MIEKVTDVPSPIDFHDPTQARDWVNETVKKRPSRPAYFAAFVSALNAYFPNRQITILELGSGPGHLAYRILSGCEVSRYVALDFSNAMHALARETLSPFLEKVDFVQQDFRAPAWDLDLRAFDAAVTMQAVHEVRHVRHQPALLRQVYGRLAPKGLFLYGDHYAEPDKGKSTDLYLSREDQPVYLRNAGFSSVRRLWDEGGMALYAAINSN